ncbi:hypothetical protein C8R44DRAFT_709937 [Mycena epipterygia]|nr:hypothetical protein C8R44DRAFT_709937 [Mycena epipterygia]
MPPAVALAYGSFGDIITTAQLIVKIVEVLRRSGKPSTACADIEKDLQELHRDLMQLSLSLQPEAPSPYLNPQTSPLDLSLQALPLDAFLTNRVHEEIVQCHAILYEFHSKTTASRDWVQMILWANSEDRELAAFRKRLVERRAALVVVMGLINSAALKVIEHGVNAIHDRVIDVGAQVGRGNDRIEVVHDRVNAVQDRVTEVGTQVGQGNDQIGLIQDGVNAAHDDVTKVSAQVDLGNERIRVVEDGVNSVHQSLRHQGQTMEQVQVSSFAKKLREWLRYPPDMAEKQHETQKLHHEGTGSWFLDSRQFSEWQDNSGSLWIQGQSGAGKTVLSSAVIRKLCDNPQQLSQDTAVAYFYFDFRDQNKQLTEIMLRSIILQLSAQSPHPYSALDRQYALLKGQTLPTYQNLLDVLDRILMELGRTYIVLDALDECKDDDLISFILRLRGWTKNPLHLLVTSQPREIFTVALGCLPHVSLGLRTTQNDIRLFVSHELRSKRWLQHVAHRAEEITAKVVERSNGMFRLAACLLHEISRSKLNPDLDTRLALLPGDLFGIYSRFLKSIDQTDFVYVATVLRWLVYSAQPITLLELEDALAFDFSNPRRYVFDPAKRTGYAIGVCRLLEGLVTMEGRERVRVSLAHASVADYLLSDQFTEEHIYDLKEGCSHTFIAQTCVCYLLYFVDHTFTTEILPDFPLASYAAQYWHYHLLFCCTNRGLILASAMHLLEDESTQYIALKHLGNHNPMIPPLTLCSHLGYSEGVQFLLENGVDVNTDDGRPLVAASHKGHTDIVRLLLDNDVDVDADDGNALVKASEQGHTETVRVLLENGADVNASQGGALRSASGQNHIDTVRLLLENSADINMSGALGRTDIIRLLLENGADINLDGGKALAAASEEGHIDIVHLLLENGADINADGGKALMHAAKEGHTDIVHLLLENGAEVNENTDSGLKWASGRGHIDVVRLLLDKGVELNPHDGWALTEACKRGHINIVKLLLENGADIHLDEEKALVDASEAGRMDVVCFLLENGADVNANHGRALRVASRRGRIKIVQLLRTKAARDTRNEPENLQIFFEQACA